VSASGTIARLSTVAADGGYTVTRTANAGYDPATGDAVDGTITTFSLDPAVVQPYGGRGVVGLKEGRHTENIILIMTSVELLCVSAAFQADRVSFRGEMHEVLKVDGPLTLRGDSHYEVYAARMVAP
jgi:hypothetical protein